MSVLEVSRLFDRSRHQFLSCRDKESQCRLFFKITLGPFFSDSFDKVSVPIESGLAGPTEAGGMFDNSYFDNSFDFV